MKTANPLYTNWKTPFKAPPFREILPEHYVPAIERAIEDANREINLIASNSDPATFTNTIEALENCGKKVGDIAAVLFNLNMAETSSELQQAAQDTSPILTRFANDITLNSNLYNRIMAVAKSESLSELNTEEQQLVRKKVRSFIMGGASLKEQDKSAFREITEELSRLSLQFEENLLAETNSFELHITTKDFLAGLPDGVISSARDEAASRGKEGWVFTLHYPSFVPFMQYSEKRELRREMFMGFSSRCFRANSNDNREIVVRIVNLRLKLAKLLGYPTYADMILEERMAASTTTVESFLKDLLKVAHPAARAEVSDLEIYAYSCGYKKKIERWDWAYWSEKLKMERYKIDEEALRSYFNLEMAQKAIFALANQLYGISFLQRDDIPVYHDEVRAFEVIDRDKSHLALLMIDYHPRKGKSGGAWMTAFREQYRIDNKEIRPIISLVCNFSRSTGSEPALLTHNELTTLLHEFGHALHGILSRCKYETLSGTNVARDFVELPSQIMENWAYEKSWLDTWAFHYLTGEKIPAETIDKIFELLKYNEGYASNRQLGFGFLDMAWHTISEEFNQDIIEFEKRAVESTELFSTIAGTNQSCAFGHLFSGGYAAGYYGYKWAEVLDADAFSLFKKRGLSDSSTAESFRKNILEKGASEDAMVLYRNFRGTEPTIDALLVRSGFKKE